MGFVCLKGMKGEEMIHKRTALNRDMYDPQPKTMWEPMDSQINQQAENKQKTSQKALSG